jgi:hypothetical protein
VSRSIRAARFLLWLAAAALAGLTIFGVMVWRSVDVDYVPRPAAEQQFERTRAVFGGRKPLVYREDTGALSRRSEPVPVDPEPLARIVILTYDAGAERLVRAEIPFWFYSLKAPAVGLMFHDTVLMLDELELTPDELGRHGPGLIYDDRDTNGNRTLIWTE